MLTVGKKTSSECFQIQDVGIQDGYRRGASENQSLKKHTPSFKAINFEVYTYLNIIKNGDGLNI